MSDPGFPEDERTESFRMARRMLDRYELIAEIARGGMGTVYLARLEGVGGFQRLFAIKLMHPHLASDKQFVAMLLDEAQLAARIHHPNAVGIVDVCHADIGYYLVMQYVEGFTLAHIMDHPNLDARDRVRLGLRVLYDGSVGLHAAHDLKNHDGSELSIVHRDVSPQNILVGVDGVGRITDFGVARAAARITSSRPGIIKGKPCYMAPEQARGELVDRRADVFALGIILWETLTNQELFYSEAGDAAMLVRVMYDEVQKPSTINPDIPEELDAVCMKALTRELDGRYQTAREFAVALDDAAAKAGLIASTHELADRMGDLFGEDIAERRESINRHISDLGRSHKSLVASDVFDVPRLNRFPSQMPTSTPGSGARDKAWQEGTAETKISDHPAPIAKTQQLEVAPVAATTTVQQPPPKSRLGMAIALGGVGIALIGATVVVLAGAGGEATEPPTTASEATVETVAEQTPVEESLVNESTASNEVLAEEIPPEEVLAEEVLAEEVLAEEVPSAEEQLAEERRLERDRRRRERAEAMRQNSIDPGMSAMMVQVEDNPYLRP